MVGEFHKITDFLLWSGTPFYILLFIMRANKSGIINDHVAKNFYINASRAGWKKHEPARIKREEPRLFSQLIYRAVAFLFFHSFDQFQ